MHDELDFEYIKEHYKPYSQNGNNPYYLIVDGYSSHVAWKVVKYALTNNIHMICLSSQSTHLLQPLNVGSFRIIQTTCERNPSAWLKRYPLHVLTKPAFLEILTKTRSEVYTMEFIVGA